MTPYYEEDGITIYHGDCRDITDWQDGDVLLTDPPYGIDYGSGRSNALPGIVGDSNLALRTWVLNRWDANRAWAVFGTWKQFKPSSVRGVLIWEKGNHVGMGDLSFPWKPNWEEIYVGGKGWDGHRSSSVLHVNAPVSWNNHSNQPRVHPHEKPIPLLKQLLAKAPPGCVVDPFMGSGTTLKAAKDLGRQAIGIEIEERYCEMAVNRLAQGVLAL